MNDMVEHAGAPLFDMAVPALAEVSQAARDALLALPAEHAAHERALAEVAALRQVEVGASPAVPGGWPLRVAAWNIERVLHPQATAALLGAQMPDVALLTELDIGMARTGQRHTPRALAQALGQSYAFGLEFLELAVMQPPPPWPPGDAANAQGFHGNALLTRLPMERPVLIRLPQAADWFVAPRGGQKRVGTRNAVAATLSVGADELVACAVHLESDTDAPGRARQVAALLEALDAYAAGRPVIVAGDLNTKPRDGAPGAGPFDPEERLFAEAEARGYDWRGCNRLDLPTTRPSQWSPKSVPRRLDWVFTRGLEASAPDIVPALAREGTPLSDHELLTVTIRPKA